ncbi:MAG: hypothetical protein JSR77_17590 [Planctomycetes bacterium]|nr:hypothetical protein [Planctomycetota bacterium]
MVASAIKKRLLKEPFEPFRIRTSSGHAYEVTAPLLVAMMKTKIFIAAPNSDDWSELSYLHITALESLSNGHHPPKPRRRGRR